MNTKMKFLCLSLLLSIHPESKAWWDEDPGPSPAPANNPSPFQHWDSSPPPTPAPASPTTHWDSDPGPAPATKPSIFNSMFGPSQPAPAPVPAPVTAEPSAPQKQSVLDSMFGTPSSQSTKSAPVQVNPQMQKDWNGFFDKVPAGQVVDVGGGTVTKNADGTATYKDNKGTSYTYNKNTSFDEVARNAPGMGDSWAKSYNYGSPANSSKSSNVPTNMQQTYNDFFDKVPVGTVVNVGGGTVTKNADGTATYRNSSGYSYNYNKNTPIDEVAKNAPGLGLSWNRSYGYQAPAIETPFNSLEEFIKWERDLKMNAKFNPNYQSPDYIKMAFMDTGPESAYGRYLFMKNNPQYVKDFENIHKGQLSTHTTDGSTIIKSNIDRMPPEIAEHYRNNPAELRAAEGFGLDPVLARKVYTGEIQLPKDINKTEWLRTHAWTPKGVVEQDNPVAYANAGYKGLNGDGGYLQNRIDPATGKIVETPQWEGAIGLEATEDHGGALIGARASTGSSKAPQGNTGSAFRDSSKNVSNSNEKSSFNSFEEFKEWERNIKMNAKFNPNYQSPDYIKMAFMDSGPESAYGRYLFMKNNPQYIQDFENIHKGQLSSHPTDGSTIIKSNIDRMPPEIAEHYRNNPAELRAAEGFGLDPVLARKVYTGEIQLPKNINKTEWLRTHAWTPNGVIEQDNPVAYANAGYRGLDGNSSYLQNRIDPATGQIVETPQTEGAIGLEATEDHGGPLRGARSTTYSAGGGLTYMGSNSKSSSSYNYSSSTGSNSSNNGLSSKDAIVYNQQSSMLKNDIVLEGVVFAENPNLLNTTGDLFESYSATIIAQNSMYAASSLAVAEQFQRKLAENIINKCSSSSAAKDNGLDGSYQLYSQSCFISELTANTVGIFKEMDGLEKQIIEDQMALNQAAKESDDREARIKDHKAKLEESNVKIKAAIKKLLAAKEAQKKANDSKVGIEESDKNLKESIAELASLLTEKYQAETSAVLALLTGTISGETNAGVNQFQVAGNDFSLIGLENEIGKIAGTKSEKAAKLASGKTNQQTKDYFEELLVNYEDKKLNKVTTTPNPALEGPKGEALGEILSVFAAMENGALYLETIALAVSDYNSAENNKQIELLEKMKTPEDRALYAATKIDEKRALLENYKKMMQHLLRTLDQNLKLFKTFYLATKETNAEKNEKSTTSVFYDSLLELSTKEFNLKLKEGLFSSVDYVGIQNTLQCIKDTGKKGCDQEKLTSSL